MARYNLLTIILLLGFTYLLSACASNKVDKPITTIVNPGKFQLQYYPPQKSFRRTPWPKSIIANFW